MISDFTPEARNTIRVKWNRTNLLSTTPENFQETMACALENQRIYNENLYSDHLFHTASFKRTSIPMVVRALNAIDRKLLNITSTVTGKFGRYVEIDASFKWDIYDEENRPDWEEYEKGILDYEADYVKTYAERLAESIHMYCDINEYKTLDFRAFGVNKESTYVVYGSFL